MVVRRDWALKTAEIRALLRLRKTQGSRAGRALESCYSIEDLRRLAKRKLPLPVYDYVEGGADAERTIEDNVHEFSSVEYFPRMLQGVGKVDTSTSILDQPAALPLVLAPTGFTRMVHHEGELAVARAARTAGLPYGLSSYGTTRMEDLASILPSQLWFQLYPFKDESAVDALMDRVLDSGCRTLVLTVDVPVSSLRTRDKRNGFSLPPAMTVRSIAEMARHPRWCLYMLRSDTLAFQNLPVPPGSTTDEMFAFVRKNFHDSLSWEEVERLRAKWSGKFVLKGLLRADDVAIASEIGCDAVVLSNHGGRQLDGSVSPLMVLQDVRERVGGSLQLIMDSGVRTGSDIAATVALGADACSIGRAYLYGLAAGGEPGVSHALALLGAGLRRTMGMLGVKTINELKQTGPTLVGLRRDASALVRPVMESSQPGAALTVT